jgi:hypothetical protein
VKATTFPHLVRKAVKEGWPTPDRNKPALVDSLMAAFFDEGTELWERIRLARLLMFLDERCGGFSLPASHGGPPIDCADAPIAEQGGQ